MISKKTQRVINFLFSIDGQDMRFTDLSEVFESLEKSKSVLKKKSVKLRGDFKSLPFLEDSR
jgi:hypothetical protein